MDATRLRVCNARDFACAKDINDVGHQRSRANVGRDMEFGIIRILTPCDIENFVCKAIRETNDGLDAITFSKNGEDTLSFG